MGVVELETILLPEDIASEATVHCLACRRKLGTLAYVDRPLPDGSTQLVVSVTLLPDVVKDFRQGIEQLELVCSCGRSSKFYVLS